MAGTLLLDQLVQLAAARGAVVRLLGDDRQLPAVEGGGALRLVAAAAGHAAADDAVPVPRPRRGRRHPAAPGRGRRRGRLVRRAPGASGPGPARRWPQAAYTGWKNDMLAGKVTLMAAADGADVTELSARARADRVAAGQVEADGVAAARRQPRRARATGSSPGSTTGGCRCSAAGTGSRTATPGTSTGAIADGSLTVRHLGHGGRVTLPADYVRDHVQLLYATTAHRAQGTTVDTAHPLITAGMSREALYVLATRAREQHRPLRRHPRPALRRGRPRQPGPLRPPPVRRPRDPAQHPRHRGRRRCPPPRPSPPPRRKPGRWPPSCPATCTPPARTPTPGTARAAVTALGAGRRARACRRPGLGRGRPPPVRRRGRRLGPRAAARHRRGQARTRQPPTASPRSSPGASTRSSPAIPSLHSLRVPRLNRPCRPTIRCPLRPARPTKAPLKRASA